MTEKEPGKGQEISSAIQKYFEQGGRVGLTPSEIEALGKPPSRESISTDVMTK